jgi:flagellar biosynthesis protein
MNKTKKTVALKYSPNNNNAPIVVASGKGEIAKKILEIAKNNGVPIKETSEDLVNELLTLPINTEIPPHLYSIVAEIIAFIYKLDKKYEQILKQ